MRKRTWVAWTLIIAILVTMWPMSVAYALDRPVVYAEMSDGKQSEYFGTTERITVREGGKDVKADVMTLPMDEVQCLVWREISEAKYYVYSIRDVDSDEVVVDNKQLPDGKYWITFDELLHAEKNSLSYGVTYKVAAAACTSPTDRWWSEDGFYFRLVETLDDEEESGTESHNNDRPRHSPTEKPESAELEGSFDQSSIELTVGDRITVSGRVSVTGSTLNRVTYQIDEWDGDDDNNRYCTQEVQNVTSVELSQMGQLVLDTTRAPLNNPGEYTLKLVASAADGTWEKLAEMTVVVKASTPTEAPATAEPAELTADDIDTEISVKLGEKASIDGYVTCTGGLLERVTYIITDHPVEGDENNRQYTTVLGNVDEIDLAESNDLMLDTNRDPLNVPGDYQIEIYAKAVGMEKGVKLADVQVHVYADENTPGNNPIPTIDESREHSATPEPETPGDDVEQGDDGWSEPPEINNETWDDVTATPEVPATAVPVTEVPVTAVPVTAVPVTPQPTATPVPALQVKLTADIMDTNISVKLGEKASIDGYVTCTGGLLERVTYIITGHPVEGDENNRQYTTALGNVDEIDLAESNDLMLDTNRDPLNVPGDYQIEIYAKAVGMEKGTWLANVQVHVYTDENPKDSTVPEKNPTEQQLSGTFGRKNVVLNPGESVQIDGSVACTGDTIVRVSCYFADYNVPGDSNNSYCTQTISEKDYVELEELGNLCLDTSRVPLNEAGNYTLELWAETAKGKNEKLDVMAVKVNAVNKNTNYTERDYDIAFKKPSTKESALLVLQSVKMARAAYSENECIGLLRGLGFENIETYNYHNTNENVVGIVIGYRDIPDENDKMKRVFAVTLRGSITTNDWISNFTVGNEDRIYAEGFDVTARNTWNEIARYIFKYNTSEYGSDAASWTDCKVWITGHSRAGAVANLLCGRELYESGIAYENIYGYTFAAPSVVKKENIKAIPYVYNYINSSDIVPEVPLNKWGYMRYGRDMVFNDSEADSRFKEKFLNILNGAAPSISAYNKVFDEVVENAQSFSDYLGWNFGPCMLLGFACAHPGISTNVFCIGVAGTVLYGAGTLVNEIRNGIHKTINNITSGVVNGVANGIYKLFGKSEGDVTEESLQLTMVEFGYDSSWVLEDALNDFMVSFKGMTNAHMSEHYESEINRLYTGKAIIEKMEWDMK